MTDIDPTELAKRFSKDLLDALGLETMRTVVERNARPEYKGCCATHDFCDANMVMEDAMIACGLGLEDDELDEEEPEDDITWLWNKAWGIAKDNDFFLKST